MLERLLQIGSIQRILWIKNIKFPPNLPKSSRNFNLIPHLREKKQKYHPCIGKQNKSTSNDP